MKKKVAKVGDKVTKKAKNLKDMSVDDFMNSFGDEASDSGSEDEQEQDHAPQVQKVNGMNGHHVSSDDEENDSDEEESGEGEELDGEEESGEDEELDGEEESGEEEELDGEEESGEDEELEGEEESGEDEDLDGEEMSGEDEELDAEELSGEDEEIDEEGVADAGDEGSEADSGDELVGSKHKKSLNKLKDLDPEFYKYLQENDKKLLQFNADSGESESEAEEEDQVHRPEKLDSDESDFEVEDGDSSSRKSNGAVTLKMVENWRASLQSDKSIQTISDAVEAFHAALLRVAPDDERSACAFKVDGSAVFNAVVQMCVLDLLPALRKYLNLTEQSLNYTNPTKCKRWTKVKTLLRSYVADLLQLLQGVASVNISTVVLKHLHQMTPFVVCFPIVTKTFLKRMISLWATGEETVRVVAFMCILRATSLQKQTLLDPTLRQMYMAYVQNTKFVSPLTLPGINFMRRSLAEMFLLDENVSYQHAFMYIRQLAIHLRNAITLQKKEAMQSVNNWQFFSSIALWVELLGASSKTALEPLLFPVVQVIVGAIKLTPTAQYYPQRFHCCRFLVNLSKSTGVFIPVLPFLLEVLTSYDFNKKHSKVSMRPLDFSCILRVSKTQQAENGFKDAIIENIYGLLLESLSNDSSSVAFPDLALPTIFQIREFLKKCKVANYSRKLKQILDKVEENSRFIENERKTATFNLSNSKAIEDWETAVRVKGTPLETFCSAWQKMNAAKEAQLKKDTIDISENLPKIKKGMKKRNSAEGPVTVLPSDDSDSDGIGFGGGDDEDDEAPKKKRGKRARKTTAVPKKKVKVSDDLSNDGVEDVGDVVEDMTEW